MNIKTRAVVLGVGLALGSVQIASAAKHRDEEDSVYEWGRWAVLSPAAGGEPYRGASEPEASNNVRPDGADEFSPKIAGGDSTPNVVQSCEPGAPCGFATYTRFDAEQDEDVGPVLATFDLNRRQITDPSPGGMPPPPGGGEMTASAVADGTGGTVTVTDFDVTNAGGAGFPDVHSVDMPGDFTDGDVRGTRVDTTFTGGAMQSVVQNSRLSHSNQSTGQVFRFNGVDAGYWSHIANLQLANILGVAATEGALPMDVDYDGYFVHGITATVAEMERFAAGRVNASYNGYVLDYSAPVRLDFDFGNRTWNGNFGTANGFTGFNISGAVDGANFSASDGTRAVNGAFFNQGFNASGAVDNGSTVGVFSADLVEDILE